MLPLGIRLVIKFEPNPSGLNPTCRIGLGPYYPIQKELDIAEKSSTEFSETSFENLASPIHIPTIIIILFFNSRLKLFTSTIPFRAPNPFSHSSFSPPSTGLFLSSLGFFSPLPFTPHSPFYIVFVIGNLNSYFKYCILVP